MVFSCKKTANYDIFYSTSKVLDDVISSQSNRKICFFCDSPDLGSANRCIERNITCRKAST